MALVRLRLRGTYEFTQQNYYGKPYLTSGMPNTATFMPTPMGNRFRTVNARDSAYQSKDLEVHAQYGLQFGSGYLSNSLSAHLTYRF